MTSTYRIRETAPFIYRFGLANFKKPLISILPYILAVDLIATIASHQRPWMALPFILVSVYFSLIFAAHIHRAYISNQSAEGFNPLQPTRADWRFILVYFLLMLLPTGMAFIAGFTGALIGGDVGMVILVILSIPVIFYVVTRLSLTLPDRAVGGNMPLKDSYRLSKGLVWKIIFTPFLASWKFILAAIGWSIVTAFATNMMIEDKTSLAHKLVYFVLQAPATYGLGFIIATIMVAGLSNYYLWARQNQGY